MYKEEQCLLSPLLHPRASSPAPSKPTLTRTTLVMRPVNTDQSLTVASAEIKSPDLKHLLISVE